MLHARALGLARVQPELSNQKTLTRTLNSMVYHKTIKSRYLSVEVSEGWVDVWMGGCMDVTTPTTHISAQISESSNLSDIII